MATTEKEIQQELKIALKEVGKIKPWYDEEVSAWVFEHDTYPVSYAGDTPEEVIQNYPLYLREFILHRLDGRVNALVEKKTKGRGGIRPGAGRPKGTTKEPTKRASLPVDLIDWVTKPSSWDVIRYLKSHPEMTQKIQNKLMR